MITEEGEWKKRGKKRESNILGEMFFFLKKNENKAKNNYAGPSKLWLTCKTMAQKNQFQLELGIHIIGPPN